MKQHASDLVNKLQQERPFELGAFLNIILMNMQTKWHAIENFASLQVCVRGGNVTRGPYCICNE